jgi:hypothetical protein
MKTLWHRFPKRDVAAILLALDQLQACDAKWVGDAEKAMVQKSRAAVTRGFAEKLDLDLDLTTLMVQIEFALLVCESVPSEQLRDVHRRLRRYHRNLSGKAHPSEG